MKPPVFDPRWPDEIKRLWEHDDREIWSPGVAPQVWIQYHNQLRVLRSLVPAGSSRRVLDVGCAQGTLALLLAEEGHDVTAVDVRQGFLDYAASRYEKGAIRFVCGNVMEMPAPGRYDVVFCNQLVEHLVYPERLVERLVEWLEPGGLLVVTTPNGSYVKNSLPPFSSLGERTVHEHRQFTADGDGHFFAFRPAELRGLFSDRLFRRVEVRFFESPWVSGHMKIRFLQPWIGERRCLQLERAFLALPALRTLLGHQLMGLGLKRV